MNRPAGITVLSNLCRIAGAILATVGIGLIVIGVFLFFKETLFGLIAIVSVIVGLVLVAQGIIGWWIGRGLAELKNWARISAIVLSMLSLFYALFLVEWLTGFFAQSWLLLIPWLGLAGLITWYLLRDDVEAAFQGQLAAAKRADVGRPTGVTVIAILCFCFAAFALRFVLIGFRAPAIGTAGSQPSDLRSLFRLLAELAKSWRWDALIAGALAALAGWGLWQRRQWARFGTIGLAAIQAALSVSRLVGLLFHSHFVGRSLTILLGVVFLGACASTMRYLMTNRVKQSFTN